MTTFAKSAFSSATYAAFRPTYPPRLYQILLNYHQGARRQLVDLGAGHGLVSRALAPSFRAVLMTDPSANMVSQAHVQTPAADFPHVQIRQASAEDLSGVASDSVDMVVAAQAAHWFDGQRAWPEIARVLRPGGTLAVWCYKDAVLVDYPRASELLVQFMYGDGDRQLGKYWEPGRAIVRGNYRDIQPTEELFESEERIEYEPGTKGANTGQGERLIYRTSSVGENKAYMRTFSSVHSWQEAHDNPKSRDEGGSGDIVDEINDELSAVEGWKDDNTILEMEWYSAIILVRKK